ncbi:putative cysteine peptidase [Mycoplasmopsis felifaucium]|uniref:Peptidase C39-like domain-containing protein n=1 Tax=Mycoplasmopsis felifaucium TaxID=35768 RepID=A0ABZ2RX45_9BACT
MFLHYENNENVVQKYEIDNENILLKQSLKSIKQIGKKEYEIKKYFYCLDNRTKLCLYIEFNPSGYVLMDLEDKNELIIEPFSKKHVTLTENDLIKFKNKNNISNSPVFDLVNLSFDKSFYININKGNTSFYKAQPVESTEPQNDIIYADVEVPYSWWFKLLTTGFGYASVSTIEGNDSKQGLCHYVAAGMLIQYNEFFRSAGYFSEKEIEKYVSLPSLSPDRNVFGYLGAPMLPRVNGLLVEDLYKKYGNKWIVTPASHMSGTISNFLSASENKNKTETPNFSMGYKVWGFISPWKYLDEGTPYMIYNGFLSDPNKKGETVGHSVVIYGYYKANGGGKYLCHYGWNYHSQVVVSTKALEWAWAIRINIDKNKEIKKPKKYFSYKGEYISGVDYGRDLRGIEND